MNIIKIINLDCPNCAKELEEEISKIEGVLNASVDFINQKVLVECTEEVLIKVKDCCNNFEEVKVVDDNIKSSFKICNLDCPNCAKELEEELSKIDDVMEVSVDYVSQKVQLVHTKKSTLINAKNICNNFEEVKVVEEKTKETTYGKEITCLLVAALLFAIAIFISEAVVEKMQFIAIIFYVAAYLLVGYPVIISTFKNILKGKVFDENFLMFIASVGAMIIGEMLEGVAVMVLYQLGELLQSIAVNSSRKEIVSLMELQSDIANLVDGENIKVVSPDVLNIDDIIQVRKGEKVPVDCVLVDNNGLFDTKSITGESMPKEVEKNQEILSGFINVGNVILAKVIRTYENSAAQKILNLVENSTSKKAQPEKFITKFAKVYTPIVVSIAFIIGIIVPLILSFINGDWEGNFASFIYRALILLVISCPCALVISVPLTYFGGIGACAKRGVLMKGAINLDVLANIDVIAFDKTGTLTEGKFTITKVNGEEDVLLLASAVEKKSTHPLARAFDNIKTPYKVDEVEEISGRGLQCIINDKVCLVGNAKLLQEKGISFVQAESISTIIYVAYDNKFMGSVEIDDVLKQEAKKTMIDLKKLGLKKLIMLSGDHKNRAKKIGEELLLDEIYGELLPEQKLEKARTLKEHNNFVYVGDGINDTLVMNEASCSISMGQLGSDVAIETSDVVLVSDNLYEVANTIRIAKKTHRIVFQNIVFSIVMKVLFMILGLFDIIPLWVAVFADVGVMLIAVINSLRMRLKVKER